MSESNSHLRRYRFGGAAGAIVVVLVAFVCMYAEAFRWAASRGVILDFTLTVVAYPSPIPSWSFAIAGGLIAAVAAIVLLNGKGRQERRRLISAAVTAPLVYLASFAVQLTSPPGFPIESLSGWQRGADFLTGSSAFVALAAVLVIAALASYSMVRQELPLRSIIVSDMATATNLHGEQPEGAKPEK